MGSLLQDVRYGLRILLKNRGFTAVAIITLALGIGANTAVFSVVDAVLLRPLPYRNSERLVDVREFDATRGVDLDWVSFPNFHDWVVQNKVFERMAAYKWALLNLT